VTKKLRVVRALVDARTRMRDVAAAAHSTAAAQRDHAARALSDEQAALESHLDGAVDALASVRHIHELDRVAESTGVYRFAVADAHVRHVEAHAASEATAGKLRDHTRQLRTAERLVDVIEEHRTKQEARAEQRGHDELAARRR